MKSVSIHVAKVRKENVIGVLAFVFFMGYICLVLLAIGYPFVSFIVAYALIYVKLVLDVCQLKA